MFVFFRQRQDIQECEAEPEMYSISYGEDAEYLYDPATDKELRQEIAERKESIAEDMRWQKETGEKFDVTLDRAWILWSRRDLAENKDRRAFDTRHGSTPF